MIRLRAARCNQEISRSLRKRAVARRRGARGHVRGPHPRPGATARRVALTAAELAGSTLPTTWLRGGDRARLPAVVTRRGSARAAQWRRRVPRPGAAARRVAPPPERRDRRCWPLPHTPRLSPPRWPGGSAREPRPVRTAVRGALLCRRNAPGSTLVALCRVRAASPATAAAGRRGLALSNHGDNMTKVPLRLGYPDVK